MRLIHLSKVIRFTDEVEAGKAPAGRLYRITWDLIGFHTRRRKGVTGMEATLACIRQLAYCTAARLSMMEQDLSVAGLQQEGATGNPRAMRSNVRIEHASSPPYHPIHQPRFWKGEGLAGEAERGR